MKSVKIIQILHRLAELLRKNGHPAQADYVAAIATIAEWDFSACCPALSSGAMWGGSGSVWEVGEFNFASEKRTFYLMLIELFEAMRSEAIQGVGAEQTVRVLKQWLAAGIV